MINAVKALKIRDVNLYTRFNYNPERERAAHRRINYAIPVILLIIVLAAVIMYMKRDVDKLKADIAKQEDIISESNGYETNDFSVKQTLYEDYTTQLELYKKMVGSYPTFDSELINKIFSCTTSNITISDFNYDMTGDGVSFSAEADSVNNVPAFIVRLRETGLFDDVKYNGYASETGDGYTFSVNCVLNEVVDTNEFDDYIVNTDPETDIALEPYDPNAEKADAAEEAAK